MIFSKRVKLADKYYQWVRSLEAEGYLLHDTAFNVITFIDKVHLLKDSDDTSYNNRPHGSSVQRFRIWLAGLIHPNGLQK